jgi:hypothetical protein
MKKQNKRYTCYGMCYCDCIHKHLQLGGENMKKETSHAKVKVFSKDCIVHVAKNLLVYTTFFT